jgi:hypothetical protein
MQCCSASWPGQPHSSCAPLTLAGFFDKRPILTSCAASMRTIDARHAQLAHELDVMGLPLTKQASAWLQRVVPARECHCVYARLPDALPVAAQLARAVLNKDLKPVGRTGGRARPRPALEVVSNCQPAYSCNQVIRNLSASASYSLVVRNDAEVAAHLQTLKDGLGLSSTESAAIVYDQYRCASCQSISASTGNLGFRWHRVQGSGASSFWQSMLRLHRRLAHHTSTTSWSDLGRVT